MTLEAYLDKHSLTNVAFAAMVGADQSTIQRMRKGTQVPSKELMARIFDVTHGAVQANDFFGLPVKATRQ